MIFFLCLNFLFNYIWIIWKQAFIFIYLFIWFSMPCIIQGIVYIYHLANICCETFTVCGQSLSHVQLCKSMDCGLPGSSVCGIFQAKNTGVGCHIFLQGIFLTQGLNSRLLLLCTGRQILYNWANFNLLIVLSKFSWDLLYITSDLSWSLWSRLAQQK